MVPRAGCLCGPMVLRAGLMAAMLALPVPGMAGNAAAVTPDATTPPATTTPAATPVPATPFRLLMVEQRGCHYCQRWLAEVGDAYPVSAEGKLAPLTRVQLRGDWPEGLVIGARPALTPTFILLKDNQEVARLEGYPGEDFFWGLLDRMLIDAGAPLARDGATTGNAQPKG